MANNAFTPDSFKSLTDQSPVPFNETYHKALFAQYVMETNNGTSNLFINHSNLFGMRPALSREKHYASVYESANGPFAHYDSPTYSVIDRMALDESLGTVPPTNEHDILRYMDEVLQKCYSGCPEEPHYLGAWIDAFNGVYPSMRLNIEDRSDLPSHQEDADFLSGLPSWSKIAIPLIGIASLLVFLKKKNVF